MSPLIYILLCPLKASEMWFSLKEVILRTIRSKNLERELEKIKIQDVSAGTIKDMFPTLSDKIKVLGYKDGTLKIRIPNSIWANELHLKREDIRQRINSEFDKEIVKQIFFKI